MRYSVLERRSLEGQRDPLARCRESSSSLLALQERSWEGNIPPYVVGCPRGGRLLEKSEMFDAFTLHLLVPTKIREKCQPKRSSSIF